MAVAKVLSVKIFLAMLLDISAIKEFLPVITSVAGPNNIII